MKTQQIVRWGIGLAAVIALSLVIIAVALVRISSHLSTSACLSKVALEHPLGGGVLIGPQGITAAAGGAAKAAAGAKGAKTTTGASGASGGTASAQTLITRAKAAKEKRKKAIKSC